MQKLVNQQGSVLVGVVVMSAIIAIASISLLQLCNYLANNEQATLEEVKSFYAAEGGLLAATYYARNLPTGLFKAQSKVGRTFSMPSNGYPLSCTLNTLSDTRIQISCATTQAAIGNNSRIQLAWEAQGGCSQYAFLFGREHPDNNPGYDTLTPDKPNDWDGPGSGQTLVGRFHINDRIKICATNYRIKFKGMVTCSNGLYDSSHADEDYSKKASPSSDTTIPNIAGYKNNFDKGIRFSRIQGIWNIGVVHKLLRDSVFLDKFIYGVPQIARPYHTGDSIVNTVAYASSNNVITLPTAVKPPSASWGEKDGDYRPTLEFWPNRAEYYYYDGSWNHITYTDYSNHSELVFKATTHLNVLGVMSGKVSVVTTTGNSLIVAADDKNGNRGNNYPGIIYQDFSMNNGSPSLSNGSNVLSLVSGKNIVFLPSWKYYKDDKPKTWNIRSCLPKSGPNSLYLFVNAALVALDDANSCCMHFDLNTWSGNYYRLFTFGSICSRKYRQEGLQGNGQVDGAVYCTDKRLNEDLLYPGEQILRNVNNLIIFTVSNWQKKILL